MSIAMAALLGMVLVAAPMGHPELWNGAAMVLMLSGVAAWLWYPPESFYPFRAAAQATVSLAIAITVPLLMEVFGVSPWHFPLHEIAVHGFLRGAFDHAETLRTALLISALSLVVTAWPNPKVPRITRHIALIMVWVVCAAALLFTSPIPLSATIAFAVAAVLGVFWRLRTRSDEEGLDTPPPYRWGAIASVVAIFVVFSLPAVLSQKTPYNTSYSPIAPPRATLDSTWQTTDPIPDNINKALRHAEWKAAAINLPFGAGAGTRLDETLRVMGPLKGLYPDVAPMAQFGWPDQPRSMLAAMTIEHGVIALFVWILMAAGGLLLARLIIRNSDFPAVFAAVLGIAPSVALAFLPGGSQMAPMFGLMLAWFLLCAPLAQAEERAAFRLVPAPSTPQDRRRAPRGRILILLIPALAVAWFAIAHARWSMHAYHGYRDNNAGLPDAALADFEQANRLMADSATLFNEAQLLQTRSESPQPQNVIALYTRALQLRPTSPDYHVARAQVYLREHQRAWASGDQSAAEQKWVESALADVEAAHREAPDWALADRLRLECLILLDRLDEADRAYHEAYAALISAENRNRLRLLRIRMLVWKKHDLNAASTLLDEAQKHAMAPETRLEFMRTDARLRLCKQTNTCPFGFQNFHEGHHH